MLPMTAHERYVRALRDAADAYAEAHCGKAKKRRRRGPVLVETGREVPAAVQTEVDARLAKAGYRSR